MKHEKPSYWHFCIRDHNHMSDHLPAGVSLFHKIIFEDDHSLFPDCLISSLEMEN